MWNFDTQTSLQDKTSIHSEHVLHYVASVISIFSDMVSYVKSCILRRVRKLKSLEVLRRFEDICGKLGEKYGVMC